MFVVVSCVLFCLVVSRCVVVLFWLFVFGFVVSCLLCLVFPVYCFVFVLFCLLLVSQWQVEISPLASFVGFCSPLFLFRVFVVGARPRRCHHRERERERETESIPDVPHCTQQL